MENGSLENSLCASAVKITPLKFNQQIYSFGQKSIAVFTKCRTDFEPAPSLEFTVAQIKEINSCYDHFPKILNTYL